MKKKYSKSYKLTKVKLNQESEELNKLLWQVLWKPLSVPQDIILKFKLTRETIKFIAK